MSKVLIHYFSGTGNTKRAVNIITEHLIKNGYEVGQHFIGTGQPNILENPDFHIIAFPVLSFDAPLLVKKYIRRLPPGQHVKTAVFATYGGNPFRALQNVEKILKRKQFDVFLTGGTCYPDNWTQMINPPDEKEAGEIINHGDMGVLEFMDAFIKKEDRHYQSNGFASAITGMIAFLFGLIGRKFLGKTYIADANCNQCRICIKTCPVGSIKIAGLIRHKPFWNFQCQDCGRCINICPQKAIQISIPRLILHTLLNILIVAGSVRAASYILNYLPPVFHIPGWLVAFITAIWIGLFIQFFIIDRLFFLLEQIPGIRKFFEWSYTKKFRRYSAPGFKPLEH